MSVTTKVKALQSMAGKTQRDLADALGISQSNLSNKFGRSSFSIKDLIKVADSFGATITVTINATGETLVFDKKDL